MRFDGNALRPSATGSPLAEHRDHAWVVNGERYFRLDCEGDVTLHSTDPQGRLGPVFGPLEAAPAIRCPVLVARSA